MKKSFIFSFVIIGLFFASCEREAFYKKVYVCHNGDNEINISINAVKAHRAHGDAIDIDGDGYFDKVNFCSEGVDCDDTNANINPGAEEINDGLDNNCDGI